MEELLYQKSLDSLAENSSKKEKEKKRNKNKQIQRFGDSDLLKYQWPQSQAIFFFIKN